MLQAVVTYQNQNTPVSGVLATPKVVDERVVQKLHSSKAYLEESLVNYFEGRLAFDDSYSAFQAGQVSAWQSNSMDAAMNQ
jgi:hypothetical protein|tara:strand:+ start:437 stop:679 length:243 start_codon:yes stop_codon:yes gene_type:complete